MKNMTAPSKPSVENKDRKILVVDDDVDSTKMIVAALQWEGYQVAAADSGEIAMNQINDWAPHLVLLDINMPGLGGIETLERLRKQKSYVSVIFVSGQSMTEDVIKGLDAGADDYVCKPFEPGELLARVRTQLRIKDLNDQLRGANEKLKELVEIDDLTGLFNMRSLYQRLEHEIERGRRFERSVCVVMMDMDYFKTVNDAHDHLFGSFVLSEIGELIRNNIRSVDFAARYGGDEFLIVLTEVTKDGARLFCERLRKTIESYLFKSGEDQMHLTASLGFALTSIKGSTIDARNLVRVADHALYDAKQGGRNQICFYDLGEHPEQANIPEHLKRKIGARH